MFLFVLQSLCKSPINKVSNLHYDSLYGAGFLNFKAKKLNLRLNWGAIHKKACLKQAFDTISGINFGLRRVVR